MRRIFIATTYCILLGFILLSGCSDDDDSSISSGQADEDSNDDADDDADDDNDDDADDDDDPCDPDPCNEHGICEDGICVSCYTGWSGTWCDKCDAGYFGELCQPCYPCATHPDCNAGRPIIPAPTVRNLYTDAVVFFRVPDGGELEIRLMEHKWMRDDVHVDIFDANGMHVERLSFLYDPEDGFGALPLTKAAELPEGGDYKMLFYGSNCIFDLSFSGPDSDWGFVILGIAHKPVLRLAQDVSSAEYYFSTDEAQEVYAGTDYSSGGNRRLHMELFDETDGDLLGDEIIDGGDWPVAYEMLLTASESDQSGCLRARVSNLSNSTAPFVLWTKPGHYAHPAGPATLITTAPELFFVPRFEIRDIAVDIGAATGRSVEPGVVGVPSINLDEQDLETAKVLYGELAPKTCRHYVDWAWREGPGMDGVNDNADPFDINWAGFNLWAFLERMATLREASPETRPLLSFEWSERVSFAGHPAVWGQEEIDEYAEFVIAVLTAAVAPDLMEPPLEVTPMNLMGVQIHNEPNLMLGQVFDPLGQADEMLNQYITILAGAVERIRSHPDPRIADLPIYSPGIGSDQWGENLKNTWIDGILTELGDDIDIVGWDPYQRYWLEELPRFTDDVQEILALISDHGSSAEIAFSEFGIHGGPPTFDNEYSSRYTQLFLFGVMARAMNANLKYPLYFTFMDGDWNMKGLVSGGPVEPWTDKAPFARQPQFYAMETIATMAEGFLVETAVDSDQIDAFCTDDGVTIRLMLSNRYEAISTATVNLPGDYTATISRFEDDGMFPETLSLEMHDALSLEMQPWTMYFLELARP